jgi:hypothetical protein
MGNKVDFFQLKRLYPIVFKNLYSILLLKTFPSICVHIPLFFIFFLLKATVFGDVDKNSSPTEL